MQRDLGWVVDILLACRDIQDCTRGLSGRTSRTTRPSVTRWCAASRWSARRPSGSRHHSGPPTPTSRGKPWPGCAIASSVRPGGPRPRVERRRSGRPRPPRPARAAGPTEKRRARRRRVELSRQMSDVFISYNSEDRLFAERLAKDLKSLGLTVWWDEWEMRVGDSLLEKIQQGISHSSFLAVVLSPGSVRSAWVNKELAAALAVEIETRDVIVLPLLLADCEIPPFLKDKIYADFRRSYRRGLERLCDRLVPPIMPELAMALMSQIESNVLRAQTRIPPDRRAAYRRYLFQCLASDRDEERVGALFALATLRDPSLANQLPLLLADPSSAVRRRVAFYLGRLRNRQALASIEHLMQDRDPSVRSSARKAFKEITGTIP